MIESPENLKFSPICFDREQEVLEGLKEGRLFSVFRITRGACHSILTIYGMDEEGLHRLEEEQLIDGVIVIKLLYMTPEQLRLASSKVGIVVENRSLTLTCLLEKRGFFKKPELIH